ncbi:MAG: DUF2190 family protein [Desulfuromonadaceae bacterium]
MAFEMDGRDITCIAGEDLTDKQYHWVKISGTAKNTIEVEYCDGAGDSLFGVLQNKPDDGEEAVVRVEGVTRLIAEDTSLALDANVGTAATGHGVAKTADGDMVGGIVVEAAAAGGDRASVLLTGRNWLWVTPG